MRTDSFEVELRETLARRAAEVPAEASDRLRRNNYRPRSRSRAGVATAGLAAAALVASGGVYLAEATVGPVSHRHASTGTPALTGATVVLAGYRFNLPAGFKTTTPPCIGQIPGWPQWVQVSGNQRFAAGASAHAGCIAAVLSADNITPPQIAAPVRIGRYQGYLLAQPRHQITLYVDIYRSGKYHWLVIAANHLSFLQVSDIASRALGQPIGMSRK
jgi:hypothetical protein